MDIALIGSPTAEMNGPARVHHGLAAGLAERGHTVTMFGLGRCQSHEHENVRVVPIPCGDSVRDALVAHREAISTARNADHDVVHSLVHHTKGADIVTVQWTTTSVDLARRRCWSALPGLRSLAGEVALSVARRRAAAAAPITVASSPETARQLRAYWRLDPDEMVPLGVPADWLTPPQVSAVPRILVPGRIAPKKGQARALRGLSPTASEYTVDIVGGVADDEYARCLADWTHRYHGHVPDAELREWYERADVAIIPSAHENFGLTALEALAHGTAVIATPAVGLTQFDWARPEEGVYPRANWEAIADCAVSLARDRGRLHAAATGAHDQARRLTWDSIAAAYEPLYGRVTDQDIDTIAPTPGATREAIA